MPHLTKAALLVPITLALFASGCAVGTTADTTPEVFNPGTREYPATAPSRPIHAEPVPPPTQAPDMSPDQNPWVDTRADNRSTFALDVDTGSFTRTRAKLNNGQRPVPEEVRTEEFINYLDQGYRPPRDGLSVHVDGTAVPHLDIPDTRVIRVGVQAAVVDQAARPRAHLTFVIDISGSMSGPEKLDLVKAALKELVGSLRPDDTVAVVVYSDNTRIVLEPTEARQARRITGVIDDLDTEGSTNAEAGLNLAYDNALRNRKEGELNRVVLLSDGVANVGRTGPEEILDTVGRAARKQVDLVTVGFGLGSYNDRLMEQLADQGNGFHAYVDNAGEARRIFTENLTGTLLVTARDAKAQVTFDPDQVVSYRLLGYENRGIADDQFRDDTVDGGEVGAGHAATALYEVRLRRGLTPAASLATAEVRYLHPDTGEPIERRAEFFTSDFAQSPEQADPYLQASIVAAGVAEEFRGGPWAEHRTPQQLAVDAARAASRVDDQSIRELAELADRATKVR